jgi:erythronate-4-phosphate dehydrogenase
MAINIVADEAIPYVWESFSSIGDVVKLPGGNIDRRAIKDADGLVIRSITKVSPALLENSKVQFVGTATIGTDHIDLNYLEENKIKFASAPGCSAITVAEFVLNCLYRLSVVKNLILPESVLGIVGAGNIGLALKERAEQLGIQCLLNDPPLQDLHPDMGMVALDELVERSDIISLHVPFIRDGKFPTFHLIDQSILKLARPRSIWINTSRGGVIDESALLEYQQQIGGLILDVWENEPGINREVLKIADIATPHIAGYSIEGKIRATQMVYEAACRYFDVPVVWQTKNALEGIEGIKIQLGDIKNPVRDAIYNTYDVRIDDDALRSGFKAEDPAKHFSFLRNTYNYRREFSACEIINSSEIPEIPRIMMSKLGFALP